MKKNLGGIHRPIICSNCGKKVGVIRLKPALQELLDKKNRKETWFYIFMIALVTQAISDLIIEILKWLL